jgi:HEAT repeat protein
VTGTGFTERVMDSKTIKALIKKLGVDHGDSYYEAKSELLSAGKEIVPELLESLDTSGSPRNQGLVNVLGEMGAIEAVEKIITIYSTLKEKEWKGAATMKSEIVKALGRIGGPDAVTILEEVARDEDDKPLQVKAKSYLDSYDMQ